MNITDNANLKPTGQLIYDVYRDGELIEQESGNNLVVDGFRDVVANLVGNISGSPITRVAVGTSGLLPASGNTTLANISSKSIDSASKPAIGQIQFNFTIGSTDFNGMAIFEFGLLTASGILVARRVRQTALPKNSSISISGHWILTI